MIDNLGKQTTIEPVFRRLDDSTFVDGLPDPMTVRPEFRNSRWYLFESYRFNERSMSVLRDFASHSTKGFGIGDYDTAYFEHREELLPLSRNLAVMRKDADVFDWMSCYVFSESGFIMFKILTHQLVINDELGLGSLITGQKLSLLSNDWHTAPEFDGYRALLCRTTGA